MFEALQNPLIPLATFLLGVLLGHRTALWRDKRQEFNEAADPVRAWLLSELEAKQHVKLFSDQLITPSLASHVAAQLVELVERKLTGVWHLCGAETVDRMTFGQAFCEAFGFDPGLLRAGSAVTGFDTKRPLQAGLKSDKAARELEAKPLPIKEALEGLKTEYAFDKGSLLFLPLK